MQFDHQVVWITGASSGIGEALARELSGRGARIILSGRRESELLRVASTLPGASFILPFEVTRFDDLPDVVGRAWRAFGSVDMLINNAGITQRSFSLDTDFSVYRQLFDVNVMAPICLTKAILPRMTQRRSGHVVAVSALAALIQTPLRTGYCASKSALIGYFGSLRTEVERHYGVRVSIVIPGSVRTTISENALAGDGSRYGVTDPNIADGMRPEDVATRIADGLETGEPRIIVAEGRELDAYRAYLTNPKPVEDLFLDMGGALAEDRETNGPRRSMGLPAMKSV